MLKFLASAALLVGTYAACDEDKGSKAMEDYEKCYMDNVDAASEEQYTKKTCPCVKKFKSAIKKAKCDDDETMTQIDEVLKGPCKGKAGCFPATATVELISGKSKSMDQLVAGDKVRVGPKEFSEVYFFSTQLQETTSKFVKIISEHGPALSLTAGHYLYVNGNELRQAGDVKVGDVVLLANGTKSPVTEITSEWGPGLYNPHTLHGDVIVDGIKTSSYTDAVHPTLAHALLMPLRQLYSAGVTFGSTFNMATKALPSYILKAINA